LNVVEAAGGRINLHSRPGEGTRVAIHLPRALPSAPLVLPKPGLCAQIGGSRRVLVVEDDPFVRQSLASTLARMGYIPFAAPSAEDALEMFRCVGRFSVALIDFSIPGCMDGLALTAKIRANWPETRVVLMSGYDRARAMDGFDGAPPDAFLQKPFDSSSLKGAIQPVDPAADTRG